MLPEIPPALHAQMQQFAQYVRDPVGSPPPPGIEARRLKVYQELFFNNIRSLLAGMFPVIRSLYTETDWSALVRAFYRCHCCETPYFPSIAEEFIGWLRNAGPLPDDKPFLLELAHYEWVELALATSEDDPVQEGIDPAGDLLAGVPVLSTLCWPLCYQFPVHRIGADFQPACAPATPTCLIVYRKPDHTIGFVESNPASIRLMELLQKNHSQPSSIPLTGEQVLYCLAEELQHPTPHAVLQFGQALLLTWQRLGIIPGVLIHP